LAIAVKLSVAAKKTQAGVVNWAQNFLASKFRNI